MTDDDKKRYGDLCKLIGAMEATLIQCSQALTIEPAPDYRIHAARDAITRRLAEIDALFRPRTVMSGQAAAGHQAAPRGAGLSDSEERPA